MALAGVSVRRTPTNVMKLRGTAARGDRIHQRENEPVPVGELGPPPAHLTPGERACWNEFVDLCCAGVLFKVDRLVVEEGACMLAEIRARGWAKSIRFLPRFERVLGVLGMTPADRSRVKVNKDPGGRSPYDD